MDKNFLAKQRKIIIQKFLIKKKTASKEEPSDSSYQTTEFPQSYSEISSNSNEKKLLHFNKGDDFLTLHQKKPASSSKPRFNLNLEGVKDTSFKKSKSPLFLTFRSKRKSETDGFLTERFPKNPQIDNKNQDILLSSYNFLKKSSHTPYTLNSKGKKTRNFTLNDLQFKQKFLMFRRQASKPIATSVKSSSHSRRGNASSSLTFRKPVANDEIPHFEPTHPRKSNKSYFKRENSPFSPSSSRSKKKSERKNQLSVFNTIFESTDLSEIFQQNIDNKGSKIKLDPSIFSYLAPSITLEKTPSSNVCELKLKNKVLLRYHPIPPKKRGLSLENIGSYATEKDLELFKKGFAETDLCGEEKKSKSKTEKEAEYQKMNRECQSITSRLYHNLYIKPRYEEFSGHMHGLAGSRLSLQQIEMVQNEFLKPDAEKNLEKIDIILRGLKFFSKFSETIRLHFLKRAKFIEFPANHTIFNEGDFGDLMYVILRGSVNIRVKKKINVYEGLYTSFVVNSFYDGDHFGDLALMSVKKTGTNFSKSRVLVENIYRIKDVRQYLEKCEEILENSKPVDLNQENEKEYLGIKENKKNNTVERTRRAATIETVEQCFCLTLGREEYQYIYNNILQKALEDKLSALMACRLFEGIEAYNLLPLANVLEEKIYKLGQTVIRKGDNVDCFFIVAKGKCDLLLEYKEFQELSQSVAFKNKGIKMKDIGDAELFEKTVKKPIQRLNFDSEVQGPSPRNFPNTKKILKNEKKAVFSQHHIIRSFLKGDCFGERALLTDLDLDNKARTLKLGKIPRETNLTVIADMNYTKVYLIKTNTFQSVPIELKNEIRKLLLEIPEFDAYDISDLETEIENWKNLAKKYIKWKIIGDQARKSNNIFRLSHLE